MTFRRPVDLPVLHWLTEGLSPKTLILATIIIVSQHFIQASRITVIEQDKPHVQEELDDHKQQLHNIRQDFVRKDEYDSDQKHLDESLREIKESQHRIEGYLIEGANRKDAQ